MHKGLRDQSIPFKSMGGSEAVDEAGLDPGQSEMAVVAVWG